MLKIQNIFYNPFVCLYECNLMGGHETSLASGFGILHSKKWLSTLFEKSSHPFILKKGLGWPFLTDF